MSKYIRAHIWKNSCPKLQGAVGIWYDSYRMIDGPETLSISLYFFGIEIEVGPELKIGEDNG